MLITLERGGGIAGHLNHQRLGPINTDDIDTGDRGLLVGLIERMDFFGMNSDWPETGRIADAMWYRMEVQDADRRHSLRWTQNADIPEALVEATQIASRLGEWENVER